MGGTRVRVGERGEGRASRAWFLGWCGRSLPVEAAGSLPMQRAGGGPRHEQEAAQEWSEPAPSWSPPAPSPSPPAPSPSPPAVHNPL